MSLTLKLQCKNQYFLFNCCVARPNMFAYESQTHHHRCEAVRFFLFFFTHVGLKRIIHFHFK